MPITRRASLPAAVLIALLGTGGCGGSVDPKAWARSVCGSLTPWRTQIAELTAKVQHEMASTKTPQQTKTNLVAFLAGAEQASETARKGVADAGVPDVDNGAHIADRFTASLTRARDAYANARGAVEKLPTREATPFYDAVSAAFAKLGEEYAASELDTGNVGSTDLQRAFDEVPECR